MRLRLGHAAPRCGLEAPAVEVVFRHTMNATVPGQDLDHSGIRAGISTPLFLVAADSGEEGLEGSARPLMQKWPARQEATQPAAPQCRDSDSGQGPAAPAC